jgi:predicted translin family RNA/ssDNA-binding protein
MVAKVAGYEASDLPERQKTAIRLADAYVIGLGEVTPELRQAAIERLTTDEVIEIAVLLFKSIQNKVRVALGTDAPEISIYVVPPPD